MMYLKMLNDLFRSCELESVSYGTRMFTFRYSGVDSQNYYSLIHGIQVEYARKYPEEFLFIFTKEQLEEIENGKMSGKEIAELIRRNNANSK